MNVYTIGYAFFQVFFLLGVAGLSVRFSFGTRTIKRSPIIQAFIFLFFTWLFFSILASMSNINDDGRVLSLSFRYIFIFFIFIFITLLKESIGFIFFKRYSAILLIISFISFISFLLNSLNISSSRELGVIDGRMYHSTFFNVYMSAVKFGDLTLTRFQSVFYEPGTFAFLFLPVVFWYAFIEHNSFKLAFSIVVLLATFSVGAIITTMAIFIIHYFVKKPLKLFPVLLMLAITLVLTLILYPVFVDFLSYKLGYGKYAGTHTSMGARMQELAYVGDALRKLLGSGFSGLGQVDTSGGNISVGFFQMIIYSGGIGAVAIIILHFILFVYSLFKFQKKDNHSTFIGSVLISFVSMGFQRSTFMDGMLLMVIFAFLCKFDLEAKILTKK